MPKPLLEDDYVRKHARAGEEWSHARSRVEAEVWQRYLKLPVCEVCAGQANDRNHATELHQLGMCAVTLEFWPPEALSERLFDVVTAHSALHIKAQTEIIRSEVLLRISHMKAQPHPINTLTVAYAVEGYLHMCRDLGLFSAKELSAWGKEVHVAKQAAEEAFVQQYLQRDPDALPWRSFKIASGLIS